MEIEAMKKQTIERLKRVKKEQELSYSKIMDMLSSKGYYLSEPTLKKGVLRELRYIQLQI